MQPEEYDKLAAVEDRMWYFRSLRRHVWRELTRYLEPSQPASLLDAGCGTGGLLRQLRQWAPAWHLRGIDFSPAACAYARRGEAFDVREASATELPFAAATFDAILMLDVLAHVAEPDRALQEIHRCLRPGGLLVLVVPAYPWLWSYHDEVTHTLRRYRRRSLAAQVRGHGFRLVASTHLNAPTLPLLVLKRKLLSRGQRGSDVALLPPLLDRTLGAMAAVERGWLRVGLRSPFGSSILLVGRAMSSGADTSPSPAFAPP